MILPNLRPPLLSPFSSVTGTFYLLFLAPLVNECPCAVPGPAKPDRLKTVYAPATVSFSHTGYATHAESGAPTVKMPCESRMIPSPAPSSRK